MNTTTNLNAVTSCLWKLLSEKAITMPLYQRDYVQGRNDEAARLIRREFIADLVGAVVNDDRPVELHFIFGGRDAGQDGGGVFVPVDGQQRLTALFLLHWYILFRCGSTEEERERLRQFHYKSRDTSERFCRHMVAFLAEGVGERDTDYASVSAAVRDCAWFTGNIGYDPTVSSMLVVLDETEAQFRKEASQDWQAWKARLFTDDVTLCPITFLRLDMENTLGNGNEIRDLYVKMNDRGKLLTDFENFKAYLHKAIHPTDTERFDLLRAYFGDTDSEAKRITLLGTVNNDYTDLFFNLIDNGMIHDDSDREERSKDEPSQRFDAAMMNLFNEMIRMEFFCLMDTLVDKKEYRNHGPEVAKMGGKEFYHFITSRGEIYRKHYELDDSQTDPAGQAILRGFRRTLQLLDALVRGRDLLMSEEPLEGAYSVKELLLLSAGVKTNAALAASRAMFAFVEAFGVRAQDDPLYLAWSRLVWRCTVLIEFEHFSDACSVGDALVRLLSKLPADALPTDLWEAVSAFSPADVGSALLEQQFKEERTRASLLCENPAVWEPRIRVAEKQNRFGQIYYLLELAKQADGTFDPVAFDSYFLFFKNHFECVDVKHLAFIETVDAETRRLFENAILISSDHPPYYHLIKKANGSQMQFHHHNYYPLLSTNTAEESPHQTALEVIRGTVAQRYASAKDKLVALMNTLPKPQRDDWRHCFLETDLYALQFPGISRTDTAVCFSEDGYCLLYKGGKQKHTLSSELHTAVLYSQLLAMGKSPELHLNGQDHHLRDGDIPARHLTCDGKTVYYQDGRFRINGDSKDYTSDTILDEFR